jgi:thiol-disulfide isomerase/thioredoxin
MKKYRPHAMRMVVACLILMLTAIQLSAQKPRSVVINGSGDRFKDNDSVFIQVYPSYYFQAGSPAKKDTYVRKVNRKVFQFALRDVAAPVYIRISYQGVQGNNRLFWVEPGDSVVMSIAKDGVTFSGRGADRFACQAEIFADENIKSPATKDMYLFLAGIKKQVDSVYQTRLGILKTYRSKIGERIYGIFAADLVGQKNFKMASDTRFYLKHRSQFNDTVNVAKVIQFHEAYDRELAPLPGTLDDNFLQSRNYTDFLLESELCKLQVQYGFSAYRTFFPKLFNRINENCKGLLHDKLMAACFLELFQRSPNAGEFLEKAVKSVSDPFCKSILQKMYSAKSPGIMAYDFSLENQSGKRVKLRDLRNKVVVADFWFNGCSGCINLNRAMKPVIDSLADNHDVVFVSINVDKDKNLWKEGIRQGIYTHEKSLNLYTNGLGENHPMIDHYGYKGYPNLLLIDKEGRVLSGNPPLPFERDAKEKLIQMINGAAQKPNRKI